MLAAFDKPKDLKAIQANNLKRRFPAIALAVNAPFGRASWPRIGIDDDSIGAAAHSLNCNRLEYSALTRAAFTIDRCDNHWWACHPSTPNQARYLATKIAW